MILHGIVSEFTAYPFLNRFALKCLIWERPSFPTFTTLASANRELFLWPDLRQSGGLGPGHIGRLAHDLASLRHPQSFKGLGQHGDQRRRRAERWEDQKGSVHHHPGNLIKPNQTNFMSEAMGVKSQPGKGSPNFIKHFSLLEDIFLQTSDEILSELCLMKLSPAGLIPCCFLLHLSPPLS